MSMTPVVVANLKIGMFVAELDRPWSETPFLTEGFVIVEADQLQVLRTYCRRVFIDPLRSSPESLSHLGDLRSKPQASNWDGDHAFDIALVRVFPEWRRRTTASSVAAGLIARSSHYVRHRAYSLLGQGQSRRRTSLRSAAVAATIPLFVYHDQRGARSEMLRARPLYQHIETLLIAAGETTHAGQTIDLMPIDEAARVLAKSVICNPEPLLWLSWIRALGMQTSDHAMKVGIQLAVFGRWLGLAEDQLRQLVIIGLMLDIGKARVDAQLLQKRDALNGEELAEVRRHVEYGLAALGGEEGLEHDVYRGISEHHERLDGSGYPRGLKEGDIGMFGRMAGIVDTFATLTTRRAYAPAMSAFDALKVLYAGTEHAFSRVLVENFMAALGIYPVGSLIELTSGEIGVVLKHVPGHQLRPRILLLTDQDKLPRPSRVVDLLSNPKDRNDHLMRIERGLPLGAYGLDPRRFQLG